MPVRTEREQEKRERRPWGAWIAALFLALTAAVPWAGPILHVGGFRISVWASYYPPRRPLYGSRGEFSSAGGSGLFWFADVHYGLAYTRLSR